MSRILRNEEARELAELAAQLAEGDRLGRGRRYLRQGNVSDLTVRAGMVFAEVEGSRPDPYEVTIACRTATDNERRAAADDVVEAVPRALDVAIDCGCPDWGDPCKHGVAALLAFAQEVDDDPSLLLRWRGLDDLTPPPPSGSEALVAPAPAPVGSEKPAATATAEEPLDPTLDAFFSGAMPTDDALAGPLEEPQLDPFGQSSIMIEDIDAAPVLAAAMEAIADHWLAR